MQESPRQFGRYTLNRMIARGGMGEIYLAHLQGVAGFEKTCVIKKIRRELAQDDTFVERFLNEGRTLVALTHTNIVQIFDMGEVDDEFYLAMEYVDGADLRALLRNTKKRQLPVKIAISVAQSVLCGLGYAHRATDSSGKKLGIVHRDVSPSNILISVEGDIKLIDFGIAKGITSESCSGVVQGKFAYMSPEQARGEKLDARSDIFSLGLVLYEMLTGIRPFEGTSDLQSLERVKSTEPQQVSVFRDDVDETLNQIVMHALAKNRDERYSSADELNDALSTYLKSIGITVDQRDIASYFKPLMNAEPIPKNMDDALNALLDAQALGLQATETKTLVPRSSSQNRQIARNNAPEAFEDTLEAAKQGVPATDATPASLTPASLTPASLTPSVTGQILQTQSSELILNDKQSRRRRMLHRIFYIALGALLACIIGGIFLAHSWSIDSEKRAEEVRESIQELSNEIKVQKAQELEKIDNQGLSQMPLVFQRGLPFKMETDPDFATIYIVEGGYRELQDKSVILLPDSDVEIAIQAPGYETCMFYVQFSSSDNPEAHNITWKNCQTVASKFSTTHQRIEVEVSLNLLQGMKNIEIQNSETKTENVLQPVIEPESAKKTNSEPGKYDIKQEKKSELNTATPNAAKSADKTQKTTELKKASVKASLQAEIVIGGKHYDLPAEIESAPGSSYQIIPAVKGKKVALPLKGTFSGSTINANFCEASVRIKESFVPNDPAPYQLSDIYLDGTRVATKADSVSLVLPCKSYVLEAKIQAGDVLLSEKQSVDVKSGSANVFSLKLKPE